MKNNIGKLALMVCAVWSISGILPGSLQARLSNKQIQRFSGEYYQGGTVYCRAKNNTVYFKLEDRCKTRLELIQEGQAKCSSYGGSSNLFLGKACQP
jgi:hypothetical protein